MPKESAGLVLYRLRDSRCEVFLVHPGGPFWAKKDAAAWSIPKGEFSAGEDPLAAAQREFTEETGFVATPPFLALGTIKASAGKKYLRVIPSVTNGRTTYATTKIMMMRMVIHMIMDSVMTMKTMRMTRGGESNVRLKTGNDG